MFKLSDGQSLRIGNILSGDKVGSERAQAEVEVQSQHDCNPSFQATTALSCLYIDDVHVRDKERILDGICVQSERQCQAWSISTAQGTASAGDLL